VVPYRVFHASDRQIAIAVGSEKLWAQFCAAIERPDLTQHPDYCSNAQRIINRAVLEPLLDEVMRHRTGAEGIARRQAAGIPASLVRNFQEVSEHPQSAARAMFPMMEHATAGRHQVTGTPIKLSDTPGSPGSGAPLLGEHTRLALGELLGLEDAALEDL